VTAPPRTRNAAATREAILASARRAFAEHGYDGAGVREIAKGAGVTAMLINRYFGSKEQLFAEATAAAMAQPVILSRRNLDAADLSRAMAEGLVALTNPGAPVLEGFQIMFRSTSSHSAAQIGREQIEQHHLKTLTEALSGPLRAERAALALSLVAGVQIMRQMMELSPLTAADPAALADLLTPMVRSLIEAPPAPAA
jgi:AcrR family transcriptional regulator